MNSVGIRKTQGATSRGAKKLQEKNKIGRVEAAAGSEDPAAHQLFAELLGRAEDLPRERLGLTLSRKQPLPVLGFDVCISLKLGASVTAPLSLTGYNHH